MDNRDKARQFVVQYKYVAITAQGETAVLLDELRDLVKRSEISGCVVGVWVKTQDSDFQDVFGMLKSNSNVNLTEALSLVKKYHPDIPFKRTSFVMHMRGTCTCPAA